MVFRFHPNISWVRPGLPALFAAFLSFAAAAQAAPVLSVSPLPTPSPGAQAAQDWGGMHSGVRSADARFIVMMIPHHEGAIAMATLGLQRSRRPEIRSLAGRIRTRCLLGKALDEPFVRLPILIAPSWSR